MNYNIYNRVREGIGNSAESVGGGMQRKALWMQTCKV